MGFFSWKAQDTGASISNSSSSRGTFPVTMTDDKGNKWHENDYEGYGVFGGKDFYELLAEMNGLPPVRDKGIDLAFSGKNDIKWPNLTEDPDLPWENEAPEDCPNQGFFYDEDEDYDQLDESAPPERITESSIRQEASDLGKKILDTSMKEIRLSAKEIDDLLESFLVNKASEEESHFIAKHPTEVCDAMESHNSDRPTSKAKKTKVKESTEEDLASTAQRDLFMISEYFDEAKYEGSDVTAGNPLLDLPSEYFEFIMNHSADNEMMDLEELKSAAEELSSKTGLPAEDLYSAIRDVCEFFENGEAS